MISASNEEKKKNRELLKKLIRSVYFLVRHRVPHTTAFEDIITLQVDNGNEQLCVHLRTCPSNATYLSKFTTVELLKSISYCIEEKNLARLKSCQYFSLMADESADVSGKEELSIIYVQGGWRVAKQ